ncbi:hypothetical protein C4D60_Mb07t28190 [Musa balbisiana]|uniref:WAT1-related protein n=1 Tax=Musa balbisiana TaxID=52838 RepID=A0A4S8JIL6_MUSBA|nr:hypothetical protein C4D60_Mb07t28190 [Musa balbisiana]
MAFMGKRGPLLGMIYVQVAYAAMFLITRLAFTRGMSHYGFVLYRQIIAVVAICPLACFLDREIGRLTFRWKNAGQIFLLALMGISISQNFYYAGLAYTSSTFVSTMNTLQPVITFLLAYLLRLEEVSIKNRTGQAKILGTFLCVGGAMACVMAQYPSQLTLSGLVNLAGGLQVWGVHHDVVCEGNGPSLRYRFQSLDDGHGGHTGAIAASCATHLEQAWSWSSEVSSCFCGAKLKIAAELGSLLLQLTEWESGTEMKRACTKNQATRNRC